MQSQKGQNIADLTEDQARAYVESLLWPDGPVCPHCQGKNVYRMQGASVRAGLLRCRPCRKQFTVTVGTIFEDSHIPLRLWVRAFHLMCASKKGVSALQLQRMLGLGSYQSAWHMAHRIRLAMECEPLAGLLKGTVEVDECYVGGKPRPGDGKVHKRGRGTSKAPVMVLVERDGRAHSKPLPCVNVNNLQGEILARVDRSARIMTDEFFAYRGIGKHFEGGHRTTTHSAGEYAKPGGIHSNTAESYIALLKRGIVGSFHHVSRKHLGRYCAEFSFRWNGRKLKDTERTASCLRHAQGRRLAYHPLTKKQK